MLEVQKYLRSDKSLDDLENEFGISHSREKNGKVSLNYDMINSPMDKRICQECRGLILRVGSWDIVSYPFNRFFNYGQGEAANIDMKTAKFLEKIDGTMLPISADKELNQFFFSTRSVPEADIVNDSNFSFSDIGKMALQQMGMDFNSFTEKLNKDYTYIFEVVSPYSTVYIYYPEPRLYLLGVRDNISLQELDPKPFSELLGIPMPKEYRFTSLNELLEVVNSWKGTEQEGIVVVDGNFNRIKVKNLDYITGQAVVFSLSASDRNIMRLLMMGQDDDVYPKCTDLIKNKLDLYKEKLAGLMQETMKDWNELKSIDNMKEFALLAQKRRWQSALFCLKRNKISSLNEMLKNGAASNGGVDKILELCGIEIKDGEIK